MPYLVKDVKFDFTDSFPDPVPPSIKKFVLSKVIGKVYHVEDEEFLADEISDETGWCILSLSYEEV